MDKYVPICNILKCIASIYKSETHIGLIFSSAFLKVSAAWDAKIVPFDCLLGWHEQVYLQIFSNIASAFHSAHVYSTPFLFSL